MLIWPLVDLELFILRTPIAEADHRRLQPVEDEHPPAPVDVHADRPPRLQRVAVDLDRARG